MKQLVEVRSNHRALIREGVIVPMVELVLVVAEKTYVGAKSKKPGATREVIEYETLRFETTLDGARALVAHVKAIEDIQRSLVESGVQPEKVEEQTELPLGEVPADV